LVKEVVIIQLPYPDNVTATSNAVTNYVGAFWKYNQRGERLIALKPNVAWSAFVLGGKDWVVMDNKPSLDATVLTPSGPTSSGNDPDFDRTHAVTNTIGWTSGKTGAEGGYFRLGLRNSHAATPAVPARYAVVLVIEGDATDLKTGDNSLLASRLLYLRQGEGADYLFPDRANARKVAA
jgi:hypothetical protein